MNKADQQMYTVVTVYSPVQSTKPQCLWWTISFTEPKPKP